MAQVVSQNSDVPVTVGVDEVGRGPLVGNVVAAAVVLPSACDWALTDSKKLSALQRERWFAKIVEQAPVWAVGEATPAEIDQLNILQATFLAMQRAVASLDCPIEKVWVDGKHCPPWVYPCEAVVQGDQQVPAISAASILAKVTRDRQMLALDHIYPGYGFAQHKGYPTPQHLKLIQAKGVIPGLYRQSFKPVQRLWQTTRPG